MKQNSSLIAASLILAALVPFQTRAATNTWNNGSANFLWDLASANWTAPTAWSDGNDAIFGATGVGTVSLGEPITVHSQTFNATGYTIAGAGSPLTLAGTTPTITVNSDSTNAASLNGTNGLTVQGTGVLSLQGDAPNLDGNHYTGGTYVRSGTLMLGARGANAAGTSYAVDSIEALDAGATVKFDTPFDGVNYTTPALHQIAAHSTAFVSHLHMTGGTFDLNDENRSQHLPIPEGTGLIINGGTNAQAGLILVADGSNHVFSGVIADNPGPLYYDAPQGPGGQIGIINIAAAINGGGGEWTLTASNTFSGSTRLQFGSIKLAGNGTIGFPTPNGRTGPLRIYGPSHLDLNGLNQTIALMTGGDVNGKIYNTAVGTVSTLTFGYGNEPSTSRNANMQYIDNPGTGGLLAMTKIGNACIQTLSGVNTYSGDTTVTEGTLALATISAVSPNSAFRLNTTPGANALLKLTYSGTANVRQLWIDGIQQPNGVYGSGTAGIDPTSTGTITVTGAVLPNTWNNGSANFLWDLASANWTAPTAWSDGNDAIFGATGVGTVSLGEPITVHSQTFNATGYTIAGAGSPLTLAGTTPTITVNSDSTNAASLNGTNGLTVQGTGVLSLQGDAPNLDGNHYTGGTYVRSGTLMLGVRGANAAGTSYAVDSIEALDTGATVKFDTLFDGTTYSSPALYQIAAQSTAFVSHLHMTGGTFDYNNEPRNQLVPVPEGTGLIINSGTTVQSGVIIRADGSNHVFSGVIADGGPLVGDNSGQGPGRQIGIVSFAAGIAGGEWTLTGSNTYSGSTRLQFASIKLAGNGTIGFPTPNGLTGPLRIYGPCHLDLNGHNQTIALMTSGDANGKIYNTAVGTVSTLTFGYGNETSTSRNAGMQYIDNPGVGGILAMTKIGNACIQTLSGVNTYSGDTTVNEGTLALATISAVSSNSAFRLNTSVGANAKLRLTYSGTANVRQLWIDGVQQPNGVYGSGTAGIDPTSTGTITVTGSAPVSLGVSQSGSSLTFSWQGVYKLQAQTNSASVGITDTWFDYPSGGASPVNVTVDPTKATVFYRLSSY